MKFEQAADLLRGIPFMTEPQARAIYDHVTETAPRRILELGTAHGVSSGYMAAALDELGEGHITTLDHAGARHDPPASAVLDKLGLGERVTFIRRADSSYDWWLKEQVQERSDADGNCEPLYDFCYIDGAHEWTIDGLAAVLAEKLLRPEGWLLLDDVTWSFALGKLTGETFRLSEEERQEPHVQAVFDLIVRQNPSFTNFRVQPDLDWAWAQKRPGVPRRMEIATSRSLGATVLTHARALVRRGAHRR